MKIAIFPYDPNFPNKYIDRMVEAIKYAYPKIEISSFPGTYNIFSLISLLRRNKYVWLNWFENLSHNFKVLSFFYKCLTLGILRLLNIKIITTFHNSQQHESTNSIWDKGIFWLTFHCSYKIIILCSDSETILQKKFGNSILKKTILIPHPTYKCNPKTNCNNKDCFSILFFGRLRPYKNIELIFEMAKIHKDITFTVAGKPFSKKYEIKLKEQAERISNLNLISHYLTSEEIDKLIDNHTILLLPYDQKSSLNSGVVIYAICKKINMIVPNIGTVNQLVNKDCIFSYSYMSPEDHIIQLNDVIEFAHNEYKNKNKEFERRIESVYREVMNTQTPDILSIKMKEVFKLSEKK